jgi:hypothetical protein
MPPYQSRDMSHYRIYECQIIVKMSIKNSKFTMKNRQNFHSPLIESYDIHEISRWCPRKHCSVAFSPSAGKVWSIIYQLTENNAWLQVCHPAPHPIAMTNRIPSFTTGKQKATDQILGVTGFYIKVSLRIINVFIISIVVFRAKPRFRGRD